MDAIETFLADAWQRHAADPAGVLARMPEGIRLATAPEHLGALCDLAVHVAGEHLGRWADGLSLVDRIVQAPPGAGHVGLARTCARARAALRLASGADAEADLAAAADLQRPGSARIRALASAAAALAGQGDCVRAAVLLGQAVALAGGEPAAADPATRTLAATANNIACALEARSHLDAPARDLLRSAAAIARRFWAIAGGWRETERAEYRLACAHLRLDETATALRHAETCRAIVAANGDDACERGFALEALARVQRALGRNDLLPGLRAEAAQAIAAVADPDARAALAAAWRPLGLETLAADGGQAR